MSSSEEELKNAFVALEAARASFNAAKAVAEAAEIALNSAERIYSSLLKKNEVNRHDVIKIEDDIEDIEDDVGDIKGDIQDIEDDTEDCKDDIEDFEDETEDIHDDIEDIKDDMEVEPRIRIRKVNEINGINNNALVSYKQGVSDDCSTLKCFFHEELHEDKSKLQESESRQLGDEFCNLLPCQNNGFKDRCELYRHQQVDHFYNRKPFKCWECGKEFDELVKLKNHGRSKHKKAVDPVFKMIDDIVNFEDDNHDVQEQTDGYYDNALVFECSFCGEFFPDESELQEHARKRFLNRECPYKDEPIPVVNNVSVKHKTKKKVAGLDNHSSKCNVCEKTFSSLLALKKHLKQSLKRNYCFLGENDELKCSLLPTCQKTRFVDPVSLFNHQQKKQHLNVKKPFQCLNCGKEFESYKKLCSHEKGFHNNIIHAIFKMNNNDFVEFTYSARKDTEKMRKDTVDKCNVCGRKFVSKEKFDLHMERAHGALFGDKIKKRKFVNKENFDLHSSWCP